MNHLGAFVESIGGIHIPIAIAAALALLVVLAFFRDAAYKLATYLKEALGWAWFVLTWSFPPFILAIAWCFASLHGQIVFESWYSPGAVVIYLASIFWILAVQNPTANDTNTSLRNLKLDFYVSAFWAGSFLAFSMYGAGKSTPELWTLLPTIVCWIDLYSGANIALNNAFQKNPTQIQKGQ